MCDDDGLYVRSKHIVTQCYLIASNEKKSLHGSHKLWKTLTIKFITFLNWIDREFCDMYKTQIKSAICIISRIKLCVRVEHTKRYFNKQMRLDHIVTIIFSIPFIGFALNCRILYNLIQLKGNSRHFCGKFYICVTWSQYLVYSIPEKLFKK